MNVAFDHVTRSLSVGGVLLTAFLAGLGLCLSLIIAPGAQNVFLLMMGIQRRHVIALAVTCLVSDAIMISAGVAGFGVVVQHLPWLFELVRWGGVLFLAAYGLSAAWRAAMQPRGVRRTWTASASRPEKTRSPAESVPEAASRAPKSECGGPSKTSTISTGAPAFCRAS